MNKKLLLSLGTISLLTTPLISVVSCSNQEAAMEFTNLSLGEETTNNNTKTFKLTITGKNLKGEKDKEASDYAVFEKKAGTETEPHKQLPIAFKVFSINKEKTEVVLIGDHIFESNQQSITIFVGERKKPANKTNEITINSPSNVTP